MVLVLSVRHDAEALARNLSPYPDRLTEAMRQGTREAAATLEAGIRSGIPEGPGEGPHARDSWGSRVDPTPQGARATVESTDEIAYYYHSGTRPHTIRPRPERVAAYRAARQAHAAAKSKGKAPRPPMLKFTVGGRTVFATSVNHPGTKPHPYVEAGGRDATPEIRRSYEEAVRRVL